MSELRRLNLVPRRDLSQADRLEDIRGVIDGYLAPAALEIQQAAHDGDIDAVRAYSYELLSVTGTVIAACPRPRRGTL